MLVRALVALVPVGALAAWSAVTFAWWKTVAAFLQLLGAACLAMVVLTHICEALGLLPWMGWGQPESLGHFVNLFGAALGFTLLPVGSVLHRRERGCLSGRRSHSLARPSMLHRRSPSGRVPGARYTA